MKLGQDLVEATGTSGFNLANHPDLFLHFSCPCPFLFLYLYLYLFVFGQNLVSFSLCHVFLLFTLPGSKT